MIFIRHKKFKDVCIELFCYKTFDDKVEISGSYWNMAFVESFPLHESVNEDIFKKDIQNWEYIDTDQYENIECLRDKTWGEWNV